MPAFLSSELLSIGHRKESSLSSSAIFILFVSNQQLSRVTVETNKNSHILVFSIGNVA